MKVPILQRSHCSLLLLIIILFLFSVNNVDAKGKPKPFSAPLSCAVSGLAVINEILISGGDTSPFVEVKLLSANVNIEDWELCTGKKGTCYSSWDKYLDNQYITLDIDSDDVGGNIQEFILFDGSGDVIDHFISSKKSCSGSWQVGSSCSSCLLTSNSSNKDFARVPDGSKTWINEGKESSKGKNNTGEPNIPLLNNFLIEHPSSGSTCVAMPVSITARDSNNQPIENYAGLINITVSPQHGDWSSSQSNLFHGNLDPSPDINDDGAVDYQFNTADLSKVNLLLRNLHADTALTITVHDAVANIASTSSIDSFSDNTFVITDGDPQTINGVFTENIVVAGRDHKYNVALWTKDPASADCSIATNYNNDPQILSAWISRDTVNDPNGISPQIKGVELSGAIPASAPSAANIKLEFHAGIADFMLVTNDVGKYSINLQDDSGSFIVDKIIGSSEVQTVRPFGIAFSNITGNNGANPKVDETAEFGAGFVAAGETFSFKLGAYLYDLNDDTNLDRLPDESADITNNGSTKAFRADTAISVSQFTPTDGVPGNLAGTAGSYQFGVMVLNGVTYSEVGSINLSALVANYLNSGIELSTVSDKIGRFYPAYFRLLTPLDESQVTNTCVVSDDTDFSYMGQPNIGISYTLMAMNALAIPAVTKNYDNASLGYAQVAVIDYHAENNNDGNDLNLSSPTRLSDIGTVQWDEGQYIVADPNVVFNRLSSVDGPYKELQLGLSIASELDNRDFSLFDFKPDEDNDCEGDANCNSVKLGEPLNMVFGRAFLNNAFGPENNELAMPFELQYWDGTRFALNLLDDCTSDFSATVPEPPLLDTRVVSVSDVSGALGSVLLSAPNQVGDIEVTLEVDDWLKSIGLLNPTGFATFGRFRGNDRVIYWREVKN